MSSKGAANARALLGGADRALTAPWRRLGRHEARDVAVGFVALSVLTLALIPVRDSIGVANIGLAMALVVAGVGFRAGLAPGVAIALYATALFVLIHSAPHGFPRVEDEQDAVTAVLLIVTGVFSGLVHHRSRRLEDEVRHGTYALHRLHRVGEVASTERSLDAVMETVAQEVASELRLAECRWHPGAPPGDVLELHHNGLIDGVAPDATSAEIGAALAEGVALRVGAVGHLWMNGDQGHEITGEQLRVAVTLADYGAAVGNPGASPPPPSD